MACNSWFYHESLLSSSSWYWSSTTCFSTNDWDACCGFLHFWPWKLIDFVFKIFAVLAEKPPLCHITYFCGSSFNETVLVMPCFLPEIHILPFSFHSISHFKKFPLKTKCWDHFYLFRNHWSLRLISVSWRNDHLSTERWKVWYFGRIITCISINEKL